MSIAVSAVVQPSRIVQCLTLAMCAGAALIGLLFGLDVIGSILPVSMRAALASLCVLAGLTVACQILRNRCWRRIDISGNGQIRVVATDVLPATGHALPHRSGHARHLHELLPSSTLWSHLMILNLQAHDGKCTTLLILPDTMSLTSFRALSVACHWIAAHNNRAERDLN